MRRVILFGGLLLLGLALAKSFGAMDRDHHDREAFAWDGGVPADGWLHVRNRSGSIKIEEGTGDGISIVAARRWTGRRPQEVDFVVNRVGNDVYVCALYGGGGENDCDEDSYRNRQTSWLKRRILRIRPVNVTFTVHAPATARINAQTREGGIAIDAPLAALVADSRNGSIKANSPIGTVEARTRNGSVSAIIADGPLTGDIVLESYNGSVTAELPEDVNAQVELQTRNGRVSTDFPLEVKLEGATSSSQLRHITSVIGTGGHKVSLETRNGSVRLESRPVASPAAPVDSAAAVGTM